MKKLEKVKEIFNLNIYEAAVYTALLSTGISSASQLADISNVPRSRCYDVLEGLEKKGFVFMKIGKPIKYIAISPNEVLETLKKKKNMERNHQLALMDELSSSDTYSELKQLYSAGINHVSTDDITTSLIGKQNINLFLKDMLANGNITIHTDSMGKKRKSKILNKTKNKNVIFKESNFRIVKKDDEILLFTSPREVADDFESAVWVKSKFLKETINHFIQ